MLKDKIVLVGGGGHCKVLIDVLEQTGQFDIIAISDITTAKGKTILNYTIEYCDDDLEMIYSNLCTNALVSLGSINDPSKRIHLYDILKKIGFTLPSIISKHAIVSKYAKIGEGTVIMPAVVINPDTIIKDNAIINTGAIIEHDCYIGNHTHIASASVLSGNVKLGDRTFIGSGTKIIQGISIGSDAIIGAGTLVNRDLPDKCLVYGVPGKIIKYF